MSFHHQPQGISWARWPVRHPDFYAYTAIHSYPHNSRFNPRFLAQEAKKARVALRAYLKTNGRPKHKWPGALSALKVPGESMIYFASTIKGPGTVPGLAAEALNIHPHVMEALRDQRGMGTQHRFMGKCAEIMVMHLWFQQSCDRCLPTNGKLIVTVNVRRGSIMAPCDAIPDSLGDPQRDCKKFLTKIGFVIELEVVCKRLDNTDEPL